MPTPDFDGPARFAFRRLWVPQAGEMDGDALPKPRRAGNHRRGWHNRFPRGTHSPGAFVGSAYRSRMALPFGAGTAPPIASLSSRSLDVRLGLFSGDMHAAPRL